MKVVGSTSNPYVRKVRIVLAEKKLDFDCDFLGQGARTDAPPPYPSSLGSPLGEAPCLVTEGGECIFDSRVIVEYLDTLSPVGKLLPAVGRERAAVKTWEALADGMLEATALAWLESHWEGRDASQCCQRWIDHQLGNIEQTLVFMRNSLAEHAYCMGAHFCLADIAVGVALDHLDCRFPQLGWRDRHSNLASLHNRLSQRSSFMETTPP
ncbi:glutathione S-transferase family protein [Candidatus Symbiobacter mobilis]|uniref:Glutathione S-transferase n=1 Tax=Candidatus Symbiobacter mobilis CR TaxID=946483 RepID=U5N4N0_9BURK|nr:glutathione S-transferase N-terminal domain-containing protein [Candidatus Symbiobacter mobilis]AGX86436.1 glutathione S-transferase [Candidatus Symbiobacter mobilis CR]